MSQDKLFIEKELSWLSFNERVLQEAADQSNPLIERIRFLGIYSNNLDEFYKVRFADLKRRILINEEQGSAGGLRHLLSKIQARVLKTDQVFDNLYNELLLEMARNHIFLVNERQVSPLQQEWLRHYFRQNLRQHITSILILSETDLVEFLKDDYTYLAVEIIRGNEIRYALLEIPSDKVPRLRHSCFSHFRNGFDAIRERDVLLYYPYHTFEHVLELLRQASFDPSVLSIKINIYRVAKDSRIINAMIHAAHNGKKVTVVVELQARFDEEANIQWAKRLTEAGVHVIFSVPGLKIHAKLFLISRREGENIVRYAHIGTGNFNEKTARLYTDYSLLTADERITNEVRSVFNFIENPYRPVSFEYLLVSPQNSRARLHKLIDGEIANAQNNLPAAITLKVNNLVDKDLAEKLYEASAAGVKINLLVRGMCSLPRISENIQVISILDRYLEHDRVYVFHNGGDSKVYISSADWMTRNIDYRIEVAAEILDPALKKQILDTLDLLFSDTVKARIVDKELSNRYVARDNRRKVRAQTAIYEYLKALEQPDE
ncbi:polyphosphate kinase 1 [Candidatus Symbiopectobacterium sp. 'North America']|uniref:polyphosphate kinase 1 n=1 Tax=Candidatus Symbiopectobacterium sp. 'North America' TaxID=2794574 RepID=UPI0018CA4B60|nr:polyphosphate kinase 1 [Candidatus Symbiopectobacterium sp. 'North America']MBG6243655.1 polyphosphate kinase 1 [Candidatus Symbiopectobacterium sp. 'North America']